MKVANSLQYIIFAINLNLEKGMLRDDDYRVIQLFCHYKVVWAYNVACNWISYDKAWKFSSLSARTEF